MKSFNFYWHIKKIDVNKKVNNSSYSNSYTSNSQNPNSNGSRSSKTSNESNALFIAVEKKHTDIVQLLIDHPNIDVNEILKKTESSSGGSNTSSSQSSSSSCSGNKDNSALLLTIENKDVAIIKFFLSNPGIDVNIVFKSSSSNSSSNKSNNSSNSSSSSDEKIALYLAVEIEDHEITKLLLTKKDIEVNTKCKSNSSTSNSSYGSYSGENNI